MLSQTPNADTSISSAMIQTSVKRGDIVNGSELLPKGYAMRLCGRTSEECRAYDTNPDICCSCIGNPVGYTNGNDYY